MSDDDVVLRERGTWLRLAGGAVVVAASLVLIGRLITTDASLGWIRAIDVATASALAQGRSPALDAASEVGSRLADTVTCIALSALAFIVLRWVMGRWREGAIIATAIVGELIFFLVVTALVPRDRPAVPHLDPAPPTSSFPSGHTAAAFALYMSIGVVVVAWAGWRGLPLAVIGVLVPFAVAVSRLYRGMHFVSDVVVGMIGGGLWLALVITIIVPLTRPGRPAA